MTGKKRFIHSSKKNRDQNFGSSQIELIAKTLTSLGFSCIFEPRILSDNFSTQNKIRNPDLKISFGKMTRFLESDGRVHGTLEQPTSSTQRRNEDFERNNMKYILINHETLRELKKILKVVISDDDLLKLVSAYLVLEQYGKHLAKVGADKKYV